MRRFTFRVPLQGFRNLQSCHRDRSLIFIWIAEFFRLDAHGLEHRQRVSLLGVGVRPHFQQGQATFRVSLGPGPGEEPRH